jgi:hypothetical protein
MDAEVFLDTLCEQYDGNITSRTRYLHGCLEKNLLPRANLLLRKVGHTLSLMCSKTPRCTVRIWVV